MVEQIVLLAIHTKGLANHLVRSALPSSGLPVQGDDAQYVGTKREILQLLLCVALSPVVS